MPLTIMQKIKERDLNILIYGGSAVSEMHCFYEAKRGLRMKNTIFLASSAYLGDPTLNRGGRISG